MVSGCAGPSRAATLRLHVKRMTKLDQLGRVQRRATALPAHDLRLCPRHQCRARHPRILDTTNFACF